MQTEIQIHQNWRKKCGRSMKGKHIDQIMGKALERRRGEKEIDRQSDLYVCIYQRRRMEWRKQRGKKGENRQVRQRNVSRHRISNGNEKGEH
jgi:hypothetical protein